MKLSTFENEVDPVILERGREYFKQDKILEVIKKDEQHYAFVVQGTSSYSVYVSLKGDRETIAETMCDCPYDKGPVCKHQVAALYHLSVSLGLKDIGIHAHNVRLSLSRLYKNELIELLTELAVKYPSEQEHLMMKHVKNRLYPDLRYLKMTFVEKIEFYLNGRRDLNSYTLMDVTDDLAQVIDIARSINEDVLFFNTQLFFYTEVVMLKEYTQDQFGSIDALLNYILVEMKQRFVQRPDITPANKFTIVITLELTLDHKLYDSHMKETVQLLSVFKDYMEDEHPRKRFIDLLQKRVNICRQREDEANCDELCKLLEYVEKWYGG